MSSIIDIRKRANLSILLTMMPMSSCVCLKNRNLRIYESMQLLSQGSGGMSREAPTVTDLLTLLHNFYSVGLAFQKKVDDRIC